MLVTLVSYECGFVGKSNQGESIGAFAVFKLEIKWKLLLVELKLYININGWNPEILDS